MPVFIGPLDSFIDSLSLCHSDPWPCLLPAFPRPQAWKWWSGWTCLWNLQHLIYKSQKNDTSNSVLWIMMHTSAFLHLVCIHAQCIDANLDKYGIHNSSILSDREWPRPHISFGYLWGSLRALPLRPSTWRCVCTCRHPWTRQCTRLHHQSWYDAPTYLQHGGKTKSHIDLHKCAVCSSNLVGDTAWLKNMTGLQLVWECLT